MKNSKIQDTLKNGLTGAATVGKKVTKTAEESAASVINKGKTQLDKVNQKKEEALSSQQMVDILNICYGKALDGIPKVSKSVDELSEDYACMTGQAVGDVLKGTGIKLGTKIATASIEKISGATLTRINQAVGFRLITKFGQTGIINLGKMVPVAGGVIGGGFDLVTTKIIAKNALKMFIETDE